MTKGKYAWGDGRGKVHSIPLATHKQNQQALRALGGSTDLTAPPSGTQAYREATAAANSQFGPQLQAARQLQTNVEPWFHDYMARVAGYAQAAQSQANPVLSQATAYQQGAAAQAPPGLDPNSEAGQQAAQAASGRQALAQLGLDALNTQNTATQDLFKGQGAVAARELPGAMTAAAQRTAGAKSQRDSAVTTFLTGARQNAQNYAIARGTLGLNTDKAAADAANTAASTAERTRHDKASETNTAAGTKNQATQGYGPGRSGQNKYGFTYDEWTALSKQQQNDWRSGKPKATKPTDQATQFGKDFYAQYGVKPATTHQIAGARSDLQRVESYVRELSNSGNDRNTVGQLLLQGGKVQVGTDHGKPVYKTYPAQDGLWLSTALDIAYNGFVSKAMQDRLHKAGFLVSQFGLPTKAPSLPKPAKPKPLTGNPLTGAPNPLAGP
jgi:hypothetical protein